MSIFENQAIEIEKSCTKNNGGMKMKALASDFDRTLFFYDESGSYYRLEDVQAIKHFQSLGNLFGVCTGRSYKGIEDFNPHQIDYDFYILCSGAKILDKEGNLIYQKFIDKVFMNNTRLSILVLFTKEICMYLIALLIYLHGLN